MDAVSVIGALGLGAVAGAIVNTYSASRRDRVQGRREWLQEGLVKFYTPIATKLDVHYQVNVRMWKFLNEHTPSNDERMMMVERNLKLLAEVREIVEDNLHYADSPDLRQEALEFIAGREINELQRQFATARAGKLTVGVPAEVPPRSKFQELVEAEFQAKSEEFRSLSPPQHPAWG